MPVVQRFDVSTSVGSPFGDDARVAAGAAWLVAELPAEDGGAGFVALDDELDVVFVGGLGGGVGEEAVVSAAEDVGVGVDAAQMVEVVEQGKDEFDAIVFGAGDGVIEASDAVFGVIVDILTGRVEDLIIDLGCLCGIVGCSEAPDSSDFVAGLCSQVSKTC